MEIPEIKSRLPLNTVLSHYGLEPNRNKMLNCPFHEDNTPSMQVYPETGTVYCFSANCRTHGHSLDVIDFIWYKEGGTKHEAIEKAKSLAGHVPQKHQLKHQPKQEPSPQEMGRIAVLSKLMGEAKVSLERSGRARDYCKARHLNPETLEAGFLGERFHHSWNEQLRQNAIDIGLLKALPNGKLSPKFRNCLVFAMKNKEGKPVGLYGRSISGKGHFYLKGKHRGLYPKYPAPETKKLVLTESIIDAATLLQEETITSHYSVLALYGTNGLTDDHKEAINSLPQLEEIILLLDGDEAGSEATARCSEELRQLVPDIQLTQGALPQGEDVNSLLQGHDPAVFKDLLENREEVFSSNESSIEKNITPEPDTQTGTAAHASGVAGSNTPDQVSLNVVNPDKITYDTDTLRITIWGGVEYSNLHRLKLSLYLENKENGHAFRDDVNLYSNRSKKAFLSDASEELEMSHMALKATLDVFTRRVEEYRLEQKEARKQAGRPEPPKLSSAEQTHAINELKDQNFVSHLKAAMQKVGLIGETDNGLLLFLIFLTRFFDNPLHALVHGSSGSGKTNLLKSILKLIPEESKYETTALTENVLFRPPYEDFWQHKILLLEDLDGSYQALLPLRELMSNQYISKFSSEPNPKTGKFEQVQLEAKGPIVIAGATTKDKVYEDNSNRSFLLHVDESKSHQQAILDYQNKQAAGLIDESGMESICRKIHNLQRMLNPEVKVVNPFQPQLKLPEYVFKKLRTNTHYITLIRAITFLHQYQRETKTTSSGQKYIETTLEDVALANKLSKHSLLRKSDELSGEVRSFFESLKAILTKANQESFLSGTIRRHMRMAPMKFNRRISELKSRGYLKQVGGNRKTGYEYQVAVWDDYQVLQKGLSVMDEVLDKLWKQYPDGRYAETAKEEV